MLLTPLYIQAQNRNQRLTDIICPCRSLIYWESNSQQLKLETRKRHTVPWQLINFCLVGGYSIPCMVIFLIQAFQDGDQVSALESLLACLQLSIWVTIFCTAVSYMKWSSEVVSFFNTLVSFETWLSRRYSITFSKGLTLRQAWLKVSFINKLGRVSKIQFNKFRISLSTAEVFENKKLFQEIRLPDGKLDILGILANFLIFAFALMPPTLPWIMMWLELDFAILPVKGILSHQAFQVRVAFHVIRIVAVVSVVSEGCQCLRSFGIYSLLLFRGLQSCQTLLMSHSIGEVVLGEARRLNVLFAVIRKWIAWLLFVYLAYIYFAMVIATTVLIVFPEEVPILLYTFFALAWIIGASFGSILSSLVVSVDATSSKLRKNWQYSCSQLQKPSRLKLLHKILRSLQPIAIPCGSLGTFTRGTRTEYFYSVTMNSISAILAFRETL